MKLSMPQRIGATILAVGLAYVVMTKYDLIPGRKTSAALVPTAVDLSTDAAPVAPLANVEATALPGTTPSSVRGPEIRVDVIPWNAEMGHHFAVGGPTTTKGSLMEKNGVRVSVRNQPDDSKALDDLVKLATQMASGTDEPTDSTTAHFVIDMGDAMAQYIAAGNKATAKLGPDYRLEQIGMVGFSRGEDKCMGQAEWKDNPESMKGAVIAAQLRQGDWNLCQFFITQNKLKTNPDETTWDPDAVNWYSTEDFDKAAQAYITKFCPDFDEVKDGHKTGKRVKKCVTGVATWTPKDVEVAHKRGGLVSLISTKENDHQMAAVIVGVHKWNVAHSKLVKNYLKAALDGGVQVRTFDDALQRAGKASYAIYHDQNPAYWVKYYKGVTETDKITQQPLALGGSIASTLDDNLCFFGLAEGCGTVVTSMYNAAYTGFGKVVQQQYPRILPSFPKAEDAVNLTFLMELANERTTKAEPAEVATFEAGAISKSDIVAKRDYSIQFATGQDTLAPSAIATLMDLYNSLLVGGALAIEIDGHTDNVGDPARNLDLSRRRAERVKQWMEQTAPALFSKNRITIKAFGDSQPVVSNDTDGGRAMNRRVTVILGTK